ncbi:hypothetical protein LCGC14_1457560 [marine sediment metagenome]|uniref:PD-(D/E)XK endonuclease-like domain-containing protein n=1 Tax=marine sediment metagenome TaxID=412755 RepID=A0A0F9K292_9ZZZZ
MLDYRNVEHFKEKCGYDIDTDTWYPRVSSIVDIKAKPALYYFYAGLRNYAEGERIKKISADEGTRIHEAVQAIFVGKQPKIDEDIAPSIKAFREFISDKDIDVDPEYIERRVINKKHRYAGTIDALARIDGKLGVLDIKTSQGIYRDFSLQIAAYTATLKDELDDIQTHWILRIDQHRLCELCGARLRTKGGRKKIKIEWNNTFQRTCKHVWLDTVGDIEIQEFPHWQQDFEGFLSAKKLWEWENEHWLKEIGYLT